MRVLLAAIVLAALVGCHSSGGATHAPGLSGSATGTPAGDAMARVDRTAGGHGQGTAFQVRLSRDGRYLLFVSDSPDLVPAANGRRQVYRADLTTGEVVLVSRAWDAAGAPIGDDDSFSASFSADGRYVGFCSAATNLVPGDTNGATDVFIADLATPSIARASVRSDGAESHGGASGTATSADGRYVAFDSTATDLVAGATLPGLAMYRHDRITGETILVSVPAVGVRIFSQEAFLPNISADGNRVVFVSSPLVADDLGGLNVYLRDVAAGTTTRISRPLPATGDANGMSTWPAISADGRWIAFSSTASNLVAGDTNGVFDIFLADTVTGSLQRIDVPAAGTGQADGDAVALHISDDGRRIVFSSPATNLVAGDTNAKSDIFLRDVAAGGTIRLSLAADGVQNDGDAYNPDISGDGSRVAFPAYGTVLPGGDAAHTHIFTALIPPTGGG